jgi:hypothetical protein
MNRAGVRERRAVDPFFAVRQCSPLESRRRMCLTPRVLRRAHSQTRGVPPLAPLVGHVHAVRGFPPGGPGPHLCVLRE